MNAHTHTQVHRIPDFTGDLPAKTQFLGGEAPREGPLPESLGPGGFTAPRRGGSRHQPGAEGLSDGEIMEKNGGNHLFLYGKIVYTWRLIAGKIIYNVGNPMPYGD